MKKKKRIVILSLGLLAIICIAIIIVCERILVNDVEEEVIADVDSVMTEMETYDDFMCSMNTVVAHNEQDTIVGDFTGKGIDTLYVVCDTTKDDGEKWQFYAKSNNKAIPRLNLWGYHSIPPKLVNEGDLDGNGTCDIGYLHTWINSQWRFYRILTLVKGEWRYLIYGDYLETPEWFRNSGKDIAESSGKKGKILVHYAYEGENEDHTKIVFEIRDTIVEPKFLRIDD